MSDISKHISGKGCLYLIPSGLGENAGKSIFPDFNKEIINSLDEFIVEDERTARRFLKSIGYLKPFDLIKYNILNKHTSVNEFSSFISSAKQGKSIGLLSEAGCPCVADPGADIVRLAHENNIKVIPLIGPSSIILGLMASGFNGQNFAFIGYLPIDKKERVQRIKQIESDIHRKNQTQIFIETPYRNKAVFEDIVGNCMDNTFLCIAVDLTLETELIISKSIKNWKKINPDINKKPVVFLLYK